MKITYINHSGFLVETENCYYVFDYYKGEMPRLTKSRALILMQHSFPLTHGRRNIMPTVCFIF